MQRTYLVPTHPGRTYLAAGVLMGLLGAAILCFARPIMSPWLSLANPAALISVALVPLLGLAILMAIAVPGVRAHLGAQVAGLVAVSAVAVVYEQLHQPDGGVTGLAAAAEDAAITMLIFAVLGCVVSTVVWSVVRLIGVRPRADDPARCPICVYEYGTKSANCPECGTPRSPRQYRFGLVLGTLSYLRRRAVLAVSVALIGVVVMLAPRFLSATVPALRICYAIPEARWVSPWFAAGVRESVDDVAVCVWIPEATQGNRGVLIQCVIREARPAKMVLTVWRRPATRWVTRPGNMRVESRLDAMQSQHLLQHGVPPELLQALYREADGRGWKPSEVHSSEPTYSVDPSPFFPQSE